MHRQFLPQRRVNVRFGQTRSSLQRCLLPFFKNQKNLDDDLQTEKNKEKGQIFLNGTYTQANHPVQRHPYFLPYFQLAIKFSHSEIPTKKKKQPFHGQMIYTVPNCDWLRGPEGPENTPKRVYKGSSLEFFIGGNQLVTPMHREQTANKNAGTHESSRHAFRFYQV